MLVYSEYRAVCTELVVTFDVVVVEHIVNLLFSEGTCRNLVEIHVHFIAFGKRTGLVSEIDTGLDVAKNLISFQFRIGAAATCDSTALILLYNVALDMWRRIE